tara:strand:+ start:721 stop:1353 length:633 start_codon:yes stop_codon:yes gene_type:complete
MIKQIGTSFYIRLVLYIVVLALSITSLASNKWGEIDFKSGSIGGITFGDQGSFATSLNLNGVDHVGKGAGPKMASPSWIHTVFSLMIAGTTLQGVGFVMNLCDLSQKNDYFVLSGYVLSFIGSVLIISAASEWMDRIKGYGKDFQNTLGTVTQMIDKTMSANIAVTSTWAPPLALASGILGAAAAVVGFSLEMHSRQIGKPDKASKLHES